ncbi:MAG: beta-galactosidase trimerization domain-containing protein [Anaerolineales bacterium]
MKDWWEGYPWRLIQTNLREIDMLDIDAQRFVMDLQTFQATVVLLNTGGIIASYPTDLPFHFQSPFLEGDSLREIISTCHAADIKVLARTDFSKVRREIYEMHPEWAYKSPEGEIVDYNGDVHVCLNGDYQQKYVFDIMEEMLTALDVDGVFFNMAGYQVRDYSGNYYGICHCESCREAFAEMFGAPLPAAEDMSDPLFRKYLVFKKRTLENYQERVYRFIQDLNTDLCIANHHRVTGRGFVRQEANTAMERPLPRWQYNASDNTKWVVASYPDMVPSTTTVDFIDFPYRHVAVSPHQQKLRLAQNLANGGVLDYYLIGRLDNHEDRSGYEAVREMFHYHAAHEEEYDGLRPKASIALLKGKDGSASEFRGWFRFLVENHFLFDTLMIDAALEVPWNKYEAIILPDYESLDMDVIGALDAFVRAGGTVISVGKSGFRDGYYEPRDAFPLECLGIKEIKTVRDDMRSSYFKLDDKKGFDHFAGTDLIYMDGYYVYAEYTEGVKGYFRLIPPHDFGPPERCYYTTITGHPAFTVNHYGAGVGIYIPWTPGSLFYQQGHTNTFDFVADLLESVAGLVPVGGDISPMVEITLLEEEKGEYQLLHLVNGSGHFGTTFFAPSVMENIRIFLPFSYDGTVLVRSLVYDEIYDVDLEEDKLVIHIPYLELFDALKIHPPATRLSR